MADEWGGPTKVAAIEGLVDSGVLVDSETAKSGKRVRLDLLEVTQTMQDGSKEDREERTLFIATDGAPADVFAGSIRKIAGLKPGDRGILAAIEGHRVSIEVEYRDFTIKASGDKGTMTLYRVTRIEGTEKAEVTRQQVLDFVTGKTPLEVYKGRAAFAGTEFAEALVSKVKTLEQFPEVELVSGKYAMREPMAA